MRAAKLMFIAVLLGSPSAAFGQGDARAAIAEGSQVLSAGWNSGDAAAIAALYTDDAVLMAPGAEPVTGPAAIQELMEGFIAAAGGSQMACETGEVMSQGDMAFETGSFVETAADGSHRDHGKWIAIWKNVDGTWKMTRHIWNSSMEQ